jgi:mono/diheme cytochrome c family protein
MRLFPERMAGWARVLALGSSLWAVSLTGTWAEPQPGLKVRFTCDQGLEELVVRPNFSLHVPVGESPAPFISGGKFQARWDGFLSVDLRSQYLFRMKFKGTFKLEINGAAVFESAGDGGEFLETKFVRLNKGANAVAAWFSSPEEGDAFLRMEWAERGKLPFPIPPSALSHSGEARLDRFEQLRRGRELVVEHRCVQCHRAEGGMPDLKMDAPAFAGIGSRRNEGWMARWILDPSGERPGATMPQLFHGPEALEESAAVAAFLASLKGSIIAADAGAHEEEIAAGKELYGKLLCHACHGEPGESQEGGKTISLRQVGAKFAPGALEKFLREPEAHFEWIRMPNFQLSDKEAPALAAYLSSGRQGLEQNGESAERMVIEKGKHLVQSRGCLNCHALDLDNRFGAKDWAELEQRHWDEGCLSDAPGRAAPWFSFSSAEREALREFGRQGSDSLGRHVAVEFAERQLKQLNCRECHGKHEGFPQLDGLGGKLKPDWAAAFLAGEVEEKPRPWLEARMPAFGAYASELARGMAMLHGFSPEPEAEDKVNPERVEVGRKLVSAAAGFSCVACHGVAEAGAMQVFEGQGINLAQSGERLLKEYYRHWMLNPLEIDPGTKMPVYFDEEGNSPLFDIFAGDGLKQIEAMWQYILLGKEMPSP